MPSTLNYLYNLERFGIKLGLDVIKELLKRLGNPEKQLKTVHITGTNGKGSTACYIATILEKAGYKTGLYTSPHLVNFTERIKINGLEISEKELCALVEEIREKSKEIQPTFFEFTTALAFLYFARKKVDIAVIEVGMGGRLDATNVLIPEVSVITHIDLDHMKYLGNTKLKIAKEKAAIIKMGVGLVTAEQDPNILKLFQKVCDQQKSKLVHVKNWKFISGDLKGQEFEFEGKKYFTKMLGLHQLQNAATAINVAHQLQQKWKISEKAISEGIATAHWAGRIDCISNNPLIMVDGAHNLDGITKLSEFLKTVPDREVLVLGIAEDKKISKMVQLIAPLFKKAIITQGNYKPAPTAIIAAEVRKYIPCEEIPSVKEALTRAKELAKGKLIFCTGSLYMVGDVLKVFNQKLS